MSLTPEQQEVIKRLVEQGKFDEAEAAVRLYKVQNKQSK